MVRKSVLLIMLTDATPWFHYALKSVNVSVDLSTTFASA